MHFEVPHLSYFATSFGAGHEKALFFFEPDSQLMDYGPVVLMPPQDVKKLWLALRPRDEEFLQRPAKEAWTKDKLREVIEGITSGPSIRIPTGCISRINFYDGRHRTKFLIEHGAQQIPVRLQNGSGDLIEKLGLTYTVLPSPDNVAGKIIEGFRHGFSPSHVASKLASGEEGGTVAFRIASGYSFLAKAQIAAVATRARLTNSHVEGGYAYSSNDYGILSAMKEIVGALGAWKKEWGKLAAEAGKRKSALALPQLPMGSFQRYIEWPHHYN